MQICFLFSCILLLPVLWAWSGAESAVPGRWYAGEEERVCLTGWLGLLCILKAGLCCLLWGGDGERWRDAGMSADGTGWRRWVLNLCVGRWLWWIAQLIAVIFSNYKARFPFPRRCCSLLRLWMELFTGDPAQSRWDRLTEKQENTIKQPQRKLCFSCSEIFLLNDPISQCNMYNHADTAPEIQVMFTSNISAHWFQCFRNCWSSGFFITQQSVEFIQNGAENQHLRVETPCSRDRTEEMSRLLWAIWKVTGTPTLYTHDEQKNISTHQRRWATAAEDHSRFQSHQPRTRLWGYSGHRLTNWTEEG